MKVELKSFKHSPSLSEETTAFTATIYIDGKRAGDCSNHGTGGSTSYHFEDRATRERFEAFCNALPNEPCDWAEDGIKMDGELYLDLLVEKILAAKDLQRMCRNRTCFHLKSKTYHTGEWSAIAVKFSPVVKAALVKQHGDDLGDILNETL